jgi:uncharacterized membrane protein YccF (DUF307 family)
MEYNNIKDCNRVCTYMYVYVWLVGEVEFFVQFFSLSLSRACYQLCSYMCVIYTKGAIVVNEMKRGERGAHIQFLSRFDLSL